MPGPLNSPEFIWKVPGGAPSTLRLVGLREIWLKYLEPHSNWAF